MSHSDPGDQVTGKRIRLCGNLDKNVRKETEAWLRDEGGILVADDSSEADWVVLAEDDLPLGDDALLDAATKRAAEEGRIEILTLSQLRERGAPGDEDPRSQQLYTSAMLAELLRVPLATVRRWHRRGLIVPVREVFGLAYFDFQQVVTARKLAAMLAAGISPSAIEKKLASLARHVRGVDRSLAQLSVIVEGRQILLRQGEGLIEPSGQLRFDFQAFESDAPSAEEPSPASTLSFVEFLADRRRDHTPEEMLRAAAEYEDRGQLVLSVEMYRAALAAGGPTPRGCFQLAELLYRLGDLPAARERYFMALELEESLVEARANLGCVLAESGELELAVAAFQGALTLHPDYADVHYHLARVWGELGNTAQARQHWQEFLRLTPDSPWAEEARIFLRG